jgi:diguanylate cyclase (GGDEF)-like protein
MNTADFKPNLPEPQRFRSLRSKALFPFFLLIVALCATAFWGSFYVAERSFKSSADERLAATQEVLFREFKKQELILETYAVIMQQFHSLSEKFRQEAEFGILQDRLFNILENSKISTAFYPADIGGLIQQKSLIDLFEQVRRSDRPRFRYSNEFGGVPVLMVAAPLYDRGQISRILLLQTTMGEAFLRDITSSLNVATALMTIDGQVLAKSNNYTSDLTLTPAQNNLVGNGQLLYLESGRDTGHERHLFSMIPLGSSDTVLLAITAPLEGKANIHNGPLLYMILIMLSVVVIGGVFYFRTIINMTLPARDLRNATEAISRGNLSYRIHDISNDELGQIAVSFNQMAVDLESTYQVRANQDIAIAIEREAGKTKKILEKKERERDKLNEELSIIQRESRAIYQLNQAMTSSVELSALFDRILQVLNEILACDHIVLLVHNPGDSALEVVRTAGLDVDALSKVRFTFNQGVTGEAAQSQRTIYVKNIDEDNRNLSYHGQFVTRGSLISVPLVVKNRLVGVINLHKRQVEAFSTSEQRLIQAVANQTAIAIDNAHLLEKSRNLSNTDELTGLSNRRHFQEILKREVAQARRFSSVFSIIMCDIDGFKQHKATLGNIQADALLRRVGQTLLKNTRGIDLVSRFGNDQFIILLPKTDKKGGIAAAEKLRKQIIKEDFSQHIDFDQAFTLTVSLGVTEFPGDSKNIYELLNLADRALYEAKQDGSNCTVGWEGAAPAAD